MWIKADIKIMKMFVLLYAFCRVRIRLGANPKQICSDLPWYVE